MREPVVPIFPLPSYFLFPGAASPLRVFEPRYRQMVEDLLDRPGRLVMATVHPEHLDDIAGDPPLLEIGGLGEIARHRRLPNGEYLMWVVGLGRVRLDEVPSDRPYRTTRVHLLEDPDVAGADAPSMRAALLDAIAVRSETELDLDDDTSVGLLADILAQCLPLDSDRLAEFFHELDPRSRATQVLEEHRVLPGGASG